MNTIPRQTHGNTPLAKKNRHDVALFYRIGKNYPYISYVPNPSRGFYVRKREYLFHSIKNNKPILFVRRKRSRSILYSISANMQWVAWAILEKEE